MGNETKISVISPSIRPDMLEIVYRSLKRQSFSNFEWLVVGPDKIGRVELPFVFIKEPAKKKGDYYALNKAYNKGFSKARGRLIVSLQDGIWITPDTLQNLWEHYIANPTACVGAIGHQYARVENGKPEGLVWSDPRARGDQGSFYEINPIDLEFTLCSVPKEAIYKVGGLDEAYDKGAACAEKEMCLRMDRMGYKFYLSQTLEYRAISHPRLNSEWDRAYETACKLLNKHRKQINAGKRLRLDNRLFIN